MKNKLYGKLLENNKIEYAPISFNENFMLIIPRQNDDTFYFEHGYYKIIDEKPAYDVEKQIITFSKWELNEELHTINAIYNITENTVSDTTTNRVKRYSKLKITLFCIEQGIWEQVKEYLTKIGFYDLFVMAQFFLETDEYFVKGLQMYSEAAVDENTSKEDIDELIETMKNFAHDGYVTLNDEGNIIGY